VNRDVLCRLAFLACAALAIAGCATQATTVRTEPRPFDEIAADKPQIWLPGARLAEVKSIALGAAHSKGWTLVSEEAERIELERPMDPASPQAIALGVDGVTEPVVKVTGFFAEGGGGVRVALDASVRTEGADAAGQGVDWTQAYRADLMRSLESLRSNWSANQERVAAALAARRSESQSPPLESDAQVDLSQPPNDPLKAAWAAETTLVDESAETPAPTTGPPGDAAEPTGQGEAAPRPGESPAISGDTPAPGAGARDGTGSPEPGMLALQQRRQPAMWTYYAERYALSRGCTLTEQGSRVVEQHPDYEIHEIECWNRPSLRLRCHNGVCRSAD